MPFPRPTRRRPSRRAIAGTALIEFALLLPILSTLLFGILAGGNYFYLAHSMQQLANDAARATIAGLTAAERTTLATGAAVAEARDGLAVDLARMQVGVTDRGDYVTVRITYDASDQMLFRLGFAPIAGPVIRRTAVVRKGGL
ncbi:TadE/TadG family type IV pilus assembly protein [Sphingomonas flavalba]|uniref:TadE/TadG family type IV pilus assembly protein n=1 Tax=Sphingomonas flavalba TaxID=2559804 RepID=UPI00109DD16D|nr:TadE/TadG family type IV pilus assembly protein [Sphingomonas flavalba]